MLHFTCYIFKFSKVYLQIHFCFAYKLNKTGYRSRDLSTSQTNINKCSFSKILVKRQHLTGDSRKYLKIISKILINSAIIIAGRRKQYVFPFFENFDFNFILLLPHFEDFSKTTLFPSYYINTPLYVK